MSYSRYLLAACAVAMAVGSANANTFAITGADPLSGTFDVVGGVITSVDLFVNGSAFTQEDTSAASGSNWQLDVVNKAAGLDITFTPSFDLTHKTDLTGLIGGTIISWDLFSLNPAQCEAPCNLPTGTGGTISPSATPLPAALPLFASGFGVMGWFGWRRKRKHATALATA